MHGAQGNEQYKNIHIKMSDLEKYTAMYKQHISMKLPPFLKQWLLIKVKFLAQNDSEVSNNFTLIFQPTTTVHNHLSCS